MVVSRNPNDPAPERPEVLADRPRIRIDPETVDHLAALREAGAHETVRIQVDPLAGADHTALDGHVPVTPQVVAGQQEGLSALAQRAQAEPLGFARELLDLLGRGDHPEAGSNPIYALYQVAIDHRCSATGYRTLCDALRSQLDASREGSNTPPTARV